MQDRTNLRVLELADQFALDVRRIASDFDAEVKSQFDEMIGLMAAHRSPTETHK